MKKASRKVAVKREPKNEVIPTHLVLEIENPKELDKLAAKDYSTYLAYASAIQADMNIARHVEFVIAKRIKAMNKFLAKAYRQASKKAEKIPRKARKAVKQAISEPQDKTYTRAQEKAKLTDKQTKLLKTLTRIVLDA